MAIQVTDERVALYCDTSDFAFGPTFPSKEQALDFLSWYGKYHLENELPSWQEDLRQLNAAELVEVYTLWFNERLDDDGELIENG